MTALQWIDTHNHLFVFSDSECRQQVLQAREAGVIGALICSGGPDNWERTAACARKFRFSYALGMHPLYLPTDWEEEVRALSEMLARCADDPHLAAIGECGLDFSEQCQVDHDVQEKVLSAQLRLARDLKLPLSLHGRGAMDHVLKLIRRFSPVCGVIHAFNGSRAQADQFLKLGFKLGYGGAMTYDGSKRIRQMLAQLPADAWVLETDCPDMPAAWRREIELDPQSRLCDIAAYGAEAARLRNGSVKEISQQSVLNTLEVFPAIKRIIRSADAAD